MNRSFALLLVATMALGTSQVFAADDAAPSTPPAPSEAGEHAAPGPHGGPGPGRFFEEADANKDGFLTKEEMRNAQDKKLDEMFARLDTNKDGKLSKDELKKGHEEMRAKMRAHFQEHKAGKEAAPAEEPAK
jgi:Skp family chaperone for outer membrane proteins